MRHLIAAVAMVGLCGCMTMKVKPEDVDRLCGRPPTLEEANTAVRTFAANALKDPDSAKFRRVVVGDCEGDKEGLIHGGKWHYGWAVYFEINAKNSYGGYVGFQTRRITWNDNYVLWSTSSD